MYTYACMSDLRIDMRKALLLRMDVMSLCPNSSMAAAASVSVRSLKKTRHLSYRRSFRKIQNTHWYTRPIGTRGLVSWSPPIATVSVSNFDVSPPQGRQRTSRMERGRETKKQPDVLLPAACVPDGLQESWARRQIQPSCYSTATATITTTTTTTTNNNNNNNNTDRR